MESALLVHQLPTVRAGKHAHEGSIRAERQTLTSCRVSSHRPQKAGGYSMSGGPYPGKIDAALLISSTPVAASAGCLSHPVMLVAVTTTVAMARRARCTIVRSRRLLRP
eukprot:6185995-Pleurochrysis_carterae.AAC.2